MQSQTEPTRMTRIIDKFKGLIDIPFEPVSQKQNKKNIIASLVNVGILIVLLYMIPVVIFRGWNSSQIFYTLFFLLVLLCARLGINRGFVNQVSFFLMFSTWGLVVFLFLFIENGVRAPIYTVMIAFLITYAGLLHGRYGAAWITALTLLVNGIAVLAEFNGYFLKTPEIPNAYWALFGQTIFFSAITFLINRTVANLQRSISMIQRESNNLHKAEIEVRNLNEQLQAAYDTTLQGWSQALELRDKKTLGHSQRVTALTLLLSRALGISDEKELQHIRYGALLHDIGKMGIPDQILLKPGSLNTEEWEVMQQHPDLAYKMLSKIPYLSPALVIPYSHHEHWDGTGYPQGLKGEEIPLWARIFSIVDVWDALSSDRPYREAWPQKKINAYLREQASIQFDPIVVDAFLDIVQILEDKDSLVL